MAYYQSPLYQHALEILQQVRNERTRWEGETFITPYQIAIALSRGPHASVYSVEDIGGKNHGEYTSLTQQIALTLSQAIEECKRNNMKPEIERGFLSNLHLEKLLFEGGVDSSMTKGQEPVSIFRVAKRGNCA